MASFFMLLCLLSALEIARHDRRRDYGLAALWLGAAIATKWPFALSALAIGEIQYRNALPWWLVVIHVSLAATIWVLTVAVAYSLQRPAAPLVAPGRRG